MGFANKIIPINKAGVYEISALDQKGKEAYYFIKVDKFKKGLFEDALLEGDFNPEKYGEIIHRGYGTTPDAVRDFIRNKYSSEQV